MQELSSKSASRAAAFVLPSSESLRPALPDFAKLLPGNSRRTLLTDTEERVFAEVLGLVGEIESLRETLLKEGAAIAQLQVQNPEVHEHVQYHGYGQKLTAQQCSDLEEENYELTKRIQELEGRQTYSLEEVAKIERQKYEELKQQLTDSQTPSEERIHQLRNKIAHLEASRHQRLHSAHPEFQILRDENQTLRQRTVQALSANNLEKELRQYLEEEAESRRQFMGDLQTYRAEFKRLKDENEVLRSRLAAREKENSGYSNRQSHRGKDRQERYERVERVGESGRVGETGRSRGDRLGEYESIIRLMQNAKQ